MSMYQYGVSNENVLDVHSYDSLSVIPFVTIFIVIVEDRIQVQCIAEMKAG